MRYKAPLFMKLYFYLPDDPDNPGRNGAHIKYIGTRSGVDRGNDIHGDETPDLDQEIIEDLHDREEVIEKQTDWELTPDGELRPGSAAHHVKYAHERPKSHGLFSSGDEEINMNEIQNELIEHKGIVWRMILSLHEEDAVRLDMITRQDWEETLKQKMPEVAEQMGIQMSNLRWVAAYHPEKGHPHAHIVFWEKNPKRRKGIVTDHVKGKMKRVLVQKIYAADRDRYGKEKTEKRDLMRAMGVSTLREAVEFSRSWKNHSSEVRQLQDLSGTSQEDILSARVENLQISYMVDKLKDISKKLPGRGRLMLKLMPPDVKKEVKELATWMYHQSQFNPLRSKYESASEALAQPYTSKESQLQEAVEKAKEEMIERLSQTVLKAAFEIGKKNLFHMDLEKSQIFIDRFQKAYGKVVDKTTERIAETILKACHQVGLSKEDYEHVSSILKFQVKDTDRVEEYFQFPPEEKKLTKSTAYLLKAALGDTAQTLLKDKGYSDEELEILGKYQKTARDTGTLAKVLRIIDDQAVIVSQLAKVLFSSGLSHEMVTTMINQWNERSGSNIPVEKINKVIKATEKEVADSRDWGRNTLLPKKEFIRMCKAVGIESPYPWRSIREQSFIKNGHEKSIVEDVFKHAFKQVSSAIRRSEADNEREQQKLISRIQKNADREEEERDRKEKERKQGR